MMKSFSRQNNTWRLVQGPILHVPIARLWFYSYRAPLYKVAAQRRKIFFFVFMEGSTNLPLFFCFCSKKQKKSSPPRLLLLTSGKNQKFFGNKLILLPPNFQRITTQIRLYFVFCFNNIRIFLYRQIERRVLLSINQTSIQNNKNDALPW